MHSFDPDIAQRVGVHAAVIYQNIFWWTQKNAANGKHIKDGYVWTFNSRTAFAKLFPYLTASQIKTALQKLCDSGLIIKGEYNASSYDRTNWYATTESAKWSKSANLAEIAIGQKSPMGWIRIANGLDTDSQPIPDINTDHKPVGKQDKAGKPPVINDASEIFDCLTMWASEAAVKSFIEYRKKSKSKGLTLTAAKRLASTLQEIFNAGENPDDALGLAEERGWQTVKADWYFQSQRTTERGKTGARSGMAEAFASVAADCAARERNRAENPERLDDISLWGVDLS
jgi:hypothetical protein